MARLVSSCLCWQRKPKKPQTRLSETILPPVLTIYSSAIITWPYSARQRRLSSARLLLRGAAAIGGIKANVTWAYWSHYLYSDAIYADFATYIAVSISDQKSIRPTTNDNDNLIKICNKSAQNKSNWAQEAGNKKLTYNTESKKLPRQDVFSS